MVFVGSGSSPTFDTDPDRQHWMCRCLIIFDLCPVREFEETERLTAQLSLAEQESCLGMKDFSAAQAVRVAQDAAKRAILEREGLVIQEHLEEAIAEIKVS